MHTHFFSTRGSHTIILNVILVGWSVSSLARSLYPSSLSSRNHRTTWKKLQPLPLNRTTQARGASFDRDLTTTSITYAWAGTVLQPSPLRSFSKTSSAFRRQRRSHDNDSSNNDSNSIDSLRLAGDSPSRSGGRNVVIKRGQNSLSIYLCRASLPAGRNPTSFTPLHCKEPRGRGGGPRIHHGAFWFWDLWIMNERQATCRLESRDGGSKGKQPEEGFRLQMN